MWNQRSRASWIKGGDCNTKFLHAIAWGLWNNRNKVHHGGKCKSSKLITREVAAYMGEVR